MAFTPFQTQDRNVTVNSGISNSYNLESNSRINVIVSAGEVQVSFLDDTGTQIGNTAVFEDGQNYQYSFKGANPIPNEVQITGNIDSSQYSILIDKV